MGKHISHSLVLNLGSCSAYFRSTYIIAEQRSRIGSGVFAPGIAL